MMNDIKTESKKYRYLASISGVSCIAIVGYLWKSLVGSGVYADETGTEGYITGFEVFLATLGVLLFVATIVLLIKYSGERK